MANPDSGGDPGGPSAAWSSDLRHHIALSLRRGLARARELPIQDVGWAVMSWSMFSQHAWRVFLIDQEASDEWILFRIYTSTDRPVAEVEQCDGDWDHRWHRHHFAGLHRRLHGDGVCLHAQRSLVVAPVADPVDVSTE